MDLSKFSIYFTALTPSVLENPRSFCLQGEKMDKVDGSDADKSGWINLEFLMDPDNPASKYSQQFSIFKYGFPEECIKRVMDFCEIENLMPTEEPAHKTRISQTLLKGQALFYFELHLRRRVEEEDSEVPDNEHRASA
jgi:hypothetical protein